MGGLTGQAGLTRGVELKGHLLDSLTLSKVIDRIQQLGGDYRLNDIRVGSLKKDISSIHLTLLAPDAAALSQLMEAIRPYGAVSDEEDTVSTTICQQDATLPADAYEVKLPKALHYQSKTVPVENGGNWTLVIKNGQANLVPVQALRQGDSIVCGAQGLQW